MTGYYIDRSDGTVYELPPIEDEIARADDKFSFNEDFLMEDWREHLEERDNHEC